MPGVGRMRGVGRKRNVSGVNGLKKDARHQLGWYRRVFGPFGEANTRFFCISITNALGMLIREMETKSKP